MMNCADRTSWGSSAEYFLQIEWLPGARIEGGEIIFDAVAEDDSPMRDADLRPRGAMA